MKLHSGAENGSITVKVVLQPPLPCVLRTLRRFHAEERLEEKAVWYSEATLVFLRIPTRLSRGLRLRLMMITTVIVLIFVYCF